jgi:hypothetical protein
MAEVEAFIDYIELQGDHALVASVRATCVQCDHTTESFGTGPGSIKRCLVLLRQECPEDEFNFYVGIEGE